MAKTLKKKASGFILVIALGFLMILSGLAFSAFIIQHRYTRHTQQLLTASQAMAYQRGIALWAKNLLETPQDPEKKDEQSWPRYLPPAVFEKEKVKITAVLWDAQGSFYNLNNLSTGKPFLVNIFAQFAKQCWPQASLIDFQRFAQNIQLFFLASPAQKTHAPSLFLIPEDTQNVEGKTLFYTLQMTKILPCLVALPEITPVNINTASIPLLMTLGTGLPLDKAQAIAQLREQRGGFLQERDFLDLPDLHIYGITSNDITLESRYFLLRSQIEMGHRMYRFSSLFYRASNTQTDLSVRQLWEKQDEK